MTSGYPGEDEISRKRLRKENGVRKLYQCSFNYTFNFISYFLQKLRSHHYNLCFLENGD